MPKLTHLEPGKWYFVVGCAGCGNAIPFAEAPSPEEDPGPLRYRTISDLKCGVCGHVDTYAPALMSRQQAQKMEQSSPRAAGPSKPNTRK